VLLSGDSQKREHWLPLWPVVWPAAHTFCIAFILFTILGVTVAAGVVRSVLLVPYFFQLLVGFTVVMATVSAVFYLRRNGMLSWAGARRKWRYLSVLYGTTIGVNILLFTLIFPALANAPAVAARLP